MRRRSWPARRSSACCGSALRLSPSDARSSRSSPRDGAPSATRRWLWASLVSFGIGNMAWGAQGVLGPLVAEEELGGAAAWGAIRHRGRHRRGARRRRRAPLAARAATRRQPSRRPRDGRLSAPLRVVAADRRPRARLVRGVRLDHRREHALGDRAAERGAAGRALTRLLLRLGGLARLHADRVCAVGADLGPRRRGHGLRRLRRSSPRRRSSGPSSCPRFATCGVRTHRRGRARPRPDAAQSRPKAFSPVRAWPTTSVWTSCVPS